jgi:hypothetical protein
VAAIELTIQWNGISAAVYQVNTAAQLIPLGIVIVLILVFLYDCGNDGASRGRGSRTTGGRGSNGNGGIDPAASSMYWWGDYPVRVARSVAALDTKE